MEMTGEELIKAPRSVVWTALNDPEILRQCIAGCETVTKLSDTEFEAAVTVKLGPVKAKFKGKVTLSDIDPPNGYTISGEAQGGVAAGFGKGGAKVTLSDVPEGTRLAYAVNAQVGGKLAQIGARLIDATAAKMAEDFFAKFNELAAGISAASGGAQVSAGAAEDAAPVQTTAAAAPEPAAGGGMPGWAWIGGLIALVLVITWFVIKR